MNTYIVTSCFNCPFYNGEYDECQHPTIEWFIPTSYVDDLPTNCPLKTESIIIQLLPNKENLP